MRANELRALFVTNDGSTRMPTDTTEPLVSLEAEGVKMAQNKNFISITLSIAVYQESGAWIAHCLEMDVVANGDTPEEAVADLQDLCRFQIEYALDHHNLASIFHPAPREIWAMYSVSPEKKRRKKPAAPIKRFEVRQYALA